jgi:5'-deoxynucleotidase YfbR-like HD superfamily hydrolase
MNNNPGWIQTYTGVQFWPLNPRIEDIHIEDIAHALSMNCRFNGHCKRFYSVAEHSVLVSLYADNPVEGLLHDAAEAYLSDIARPIKQHLPKFQKIENNLLKIIYKRYNIVSNPQTKEIDNRILLDEKQQLMNNEPADWCLNVDRLGVAINSWPSYQAKHEFLKRFKELYEDRGRG